MIMVPLLARIPLQERDWNRAQLSIKAEELGKFGLAQFPLVMGGILRGCRPRDL
jgi:hypothetical protein